MVNEACNLRCPYCFAEEFVNHNPKEMALEDFRTALDFALSDREERQVGIIGGEPLLYKHINEVMRIAMNDRRTDHVMIYTNAVELERLDPEILLSAKFRMLVNCNSPEDIGEKAFEKMCGNLMRFVEDYSGDGRFRLSVNIYKPDFDYTYVIPIVQSIGFDVVRLSVSVPQKGDLKGKSPLEYFREMKPLAIRFIGDMLHCGAITGFDCNFIPECVFTNAERESLMSSKSVLRNALWRNYSQVFWDRVMFCEINNCTPVIDILPDLRAIRCFGLSEYTKEKISDFRDINELRRHYNDAVDKELCKYWTEDICKTCYNREIMLCSCGCLLFKAEQALKKEDAV